MKLHRGRLIDHVQIISKDFQKSKHFYKSILAILEIPLDMEGPEYLASDEIFVCSTQYDKDSKVPTGPIHLAFQAKDQETVQRFYRAGLEAGGQDDGPPGERHYHPGYYAAFLLDPDGNYLEAVYHGPAKRSANSVEITF